MVAVSKCGFPGSSRSGEKARLKSSPARSPETLSRIGLTTSSVVPIGATLEDHELARAQVRRDGARRVLDVRHVRFALGRERRGHAEQQRIRLARPAEIEGHGE